VLVDDQLFARVASTQSPQGIAALVELARGDLDAVIRRHDTLLVVACGLQDPGNLGTIMRSAVALGATGLLCLKETVSPFNPKAARASAGAIFHLPIITGLDAADLFPRLSAAHVRTIGAERESPHALHQTDLQGPLAVLIGKEATGLSQDILNRADMLLSIPIRPGMDSVNAATAAGIFLYEAARQRGFKIMCG
jgi:TrmH family RNA methyltransferase